MLHALRVYTILYVWRARAILFSVSFYIFEFAIKSFPVNVSLSPSLLWTMIIIQLFFEKFVGSFMIEFACWREHQSKAHYAFSQPINKVYFWFIILLMWQTQAHHCINLGIKIKSATFLVLCHSMNFLPNLLLQKSSSNFWYKIRLWLELIAYSCQSCE